MCFEDFRTCLILEGKFKFNVCGNLGLIFCVFFAIQFQEKLFWKLLSTKIKESHSIKMIL